VFIQSILPPIPQKLLHFVAVSKASGYHPLRRAQCKVMKEKKTAKKVVE
jgi:hypothetical protein